MATLTMTAVEKFIKLGVPDGKQHATLLSGDGLRLRLLKTGSASWQFIYRPRGLGRAATPKTFTIGAYPSICVKDAMNEAKRLAGAVASGGDPRADAREEKRAERAIISKSLDEYEAWCARRGLAKVDTMLSSLRRGLKPWMDRDLKDIDRRTFIDAIEGIEREGKLGAARDFRKFLRTYLNRQLSLGVIVADPLAGYRQPAASKADKIAVEEHGKALTPGELVAVWKAAEVRSGAFGALVRLGLLTGLRRGELAALRWSWIDVDALRITIPAEVMKAGREHVVPITAGVVALLESIPNRGADLVFPSDRRLGAATMLSGWSKMIDRLRANSGVEFSLHDCRRTFRSALAELGVVHEIAEAMIAHQQADLVRRYNRAELWDARRAAADKYDAWLASIVSPADTAENVVRIGSKR